MLSADATESFDDKILSLFDSECTEQRRQKFENKFE